MHQSWIFSISLVVISGSFEINFVFNLTWTWTNDLLETCELTCLLDL